MNVVADVCWRTSPTNPERGGYVPVVRVDGAIVKVCPIRLRFDRACVVAERMAADWLRGKR